MTMGMNEKKGKREYSEMKGKGSKMEKMHDGHGHHKGRMHDSFTRVEDAPVITRHKGKPSGCME